MSDFYDPVNLDSPPTTPPALLATFLTCVICIWNQFEINQETLDILVANIIPTSKYFEARFDHLEDRFERMQGDLTSLRSDIDKRFEQMINSIDKLTDKLDHRDERQRSFTIRMFTISITISILGVTGAFLKVLAII